MWKFFINYKNSDSINKYIIKKNITNFDSLLYSITYLSNLFDTHMTLLYYLSLPEKESSNKTIFLKKFLCNNVGDFVINKCECYIGYFENHCQINAKYYWGKLWNVYQTFFSLLFCLFLILTWYNLFKILFKKENIFKKILQLIIIPKNLVTINLCFITLSRFIYIVYDPFNLKKLFGRSIERILFLMINANIMNIYCILIIMWLGLNEVFIIGNKLKKRINHYFYVQKKYTLIFILLISYPYHIVINYLIYTEKSLISQKPKIIINSLYILYNYLTIIIFIYGCCSLCKMKDKLDSIYKFSLDKNRSIIPKVVINENNDNTIVESSIELKDNNNNIQINNENIVLNNQYKNNTKIKKNILFLQKIFENNLYEEINDLIKNNDKCEESEDYLLDYQSEIKILNIFNKENSNLNSKNDLEKIHIKRKKSLYTSYEDKNNEYKEIDDFFLTQNDKENISSIINMSFLLLIITITISLYLNFIQSSFFASNYFTLFILVFFTSGLEILFIFCTYMLFNQKRLSHEYKNLKIIGEIEKFLNPKKKKSIHFKEIKNLYIFRRLKDFINFE